jgi:hypothetical protein
MSVQSIDVFEYDGCEKKEYRLKDGYIMTIQSCDKNIAAIKIMGDTETTTGFKMVNIDSRETIQPWKNTYMISFHGNYELFYKDSLVVRILHPHRQDVIVMG